MNRPPAHPTGTKGLAKGRVKGQTKNRGSRLLHQKVKTARGRKLSSTRWLERQLNDPYVEAARSQGYRSRAAYKLMEMNERECFLRSGMKVLDLGAAPGGWSQVCVEYVKKSAQGRVIALDINPMDALDGVEILHMDFLAPDAPEILRRCLNGPCDAVLSDMAAPSSGHAPTDHIRIVALCDAAADFAMGVLDEGGVFIAKVLQGGTENTLLKRLKQHFQIVRHIKPPASRSGSSEIYVLAKGFRKSPVL